MINGLFIEGPSQYTIYRKYKDRHYASIVRIVDDTVVSACLIDPDDYTILHNPYRNLIGHYVWDSRPDGLILLRCESCGPTALIRPVTDTLPVDLAEALKA